MNEFEKEMINYLGKENFNKVQTVKVGIAGAGGLGSNCAMNLARTGFKKIKIIDFDDVECKNLNRQFFFFDQIGKKKVKMLKETLERINPDIEIETSDTKLEESNIVEAFEDCDIVVEAFDKAEYKSLIVKELAPIKKLVVSASGLAGYGKSDDIIMRKLKDNLVMIGDLKSEATEDLPPLSPRVNIAAAKQADAVLEFVLDKY